MTLSALLGAMSEKKYTFRSVEKKSHINKAKLRLNELPVNESGCRVLNLIYRSFHDSPSLWDYSRGSWSPSGGLSTDGVYIDQSKIWIDSQTEGLRLNQIGSVRIYVLIGYRLYGFIMGCPRKEKTRTGGIAIQKLLSSFKKVGVDITPYKVEEKEGLAIKESMAHPLIQCVELPLSLSAYGYVRGANHIDFHESYRGALEKKYPDLAKGFAQVDLDYPDHKENKDIINYSIGMFQSKYMQYAYSKISKDAIDGTHDAVYSLSERLKKEGYLILGWNTDGIWYMPGRRAVPPIYHGEGEGSKVGEWSNDYTDCDWCPISDGGNWVVLDGLKKGRRGFYKALRGNYGYSGVKAYEDWDCWDDVLKALDTAEIREIDFDEKKGWSTHVIPLKYRRMTDQPKDVTNETMLQGRSLI